jgi:cell wall-associated NlpC family hydrolase
VFFDGNKNGKLQPTDHVGIYPGNGHLIHASNYFGEVVEGKMKKIDGCWGAKKMTRLR